MPPTKKLLGRESSRSKRWGRLLAAGTVTLAAAGTLLAQGTDDDKEPELPPVLIVEPREELEVTKRKVQYLVGLAGLCQGLKVTLPAKRLDSRAKVEVTLECIQQVVDWGWYQRDFVREWAAEAGRNGPTREGRVQIPPFTAPDCDGVAMPGYQKVFTMWACGMSRCVAPTGTWPVGGLPQTRAHALLKKCATDSLQAVRDTVRGFRFVRPD